MERYAKNKNPLPLENLKINFLEHYIFDRAKSWSYEEQFLIILSFLGDKLFRVRLSTNNGSCWHLKISYEWCIFVFKKVLSSIMYKHFTELIIKCEHYLKNLQIYFFNLHIAIWCWTKNFKQIQYINIFHYFLQFSQCINNIWN